MRKIITKRIESVLLIVILLTSACSNNVGRQEFKKGVIDNSKSPYTKLRSIPMQDTKLTTGFWADRFDLAAEKMLPALEKDMLGDGVAN